MKRGDWLLQNEPLPPTDRISVQILAEVPLNESQPVHIYHGASRTTGKLTLLQGKNAAKNDRSLAEIILDSPLFLAFWRQTYFTQWRYKNLNCRRTSIGN